MIALLLQFMFGCDLSKFYFPSTDCPCIEDIKEFRREIEVMKSVGIHPNIVGIVGHCIKNLDEMMLLTEYCSNGNLLNFLR